MRHNISAMLSWEIRSNAFLRSSCAMNTGMFHSRASSVQRSIMYTASAPCLCGMKAVCSVFSRHSVRAPLALFQPGQTLSDITWGDFNNARRHSRIRSFLAFSCNSRSAGTVISKNVSVETSDGRRRKFLPKNSQPVTVIATFPLHWRSDDCTVSVQQPS